MNQGENVVMDLTSHLDHGYNITVDNFFTSIPLALKLLSRKKKEMTLLGTLKANRKHIPAFIKNFPKTEQYSSKFAFAEEIMLVNYVYKTNKSVILLSSSLPTNELLIGEKMKPLIIDHYNHTKFGVDKLDEMTKSMSCGRATRRWTINVFSNMLDMICLNAYVCYKLANNLNISRKDFMTELIKKLIKSNAMNRVSIPQVPSKVKSEIRKMYPEAEVSTVKSDAETTKPAKDARCDLCVGQYRIKKRATRFCITCNQKVCSDHQKAPKCISCQ